VNQTKIDKQQVKILRVRQEDSMEFGVETGKNVWGRA